MLRKLANTFIIRDKVGAGVSISIGAALICLSVFFRGDYSIAGRVFFIAMGLSQILFAIAGLFPDRKGQLKFSFQVVGLLILLSMVVFLMLFWLLLMNTK